MKKLSCQIRAAPLVISGVPVERIERIPVLSLYFIPSKPLHCQVLGRNLLAFLTYIFPFVLLHVHQKVIKTVAQTVKLEACTMYSFDCSNGTAFLSSVENLFP